MPPTLALKRALGGGIAGKNQGLFSWGRTRTSSICLFCSLSTRPLTTTTRRRPLPLREQNTRLLAGGTRSFHTTETLIPSATQMQEQQAVEPPRAKLARLLRELQIQIPEYVKSERLNLALRNLSEPPGQESIRVAILNPAREDGHENTEASKSLLRAALADELGEQAAWETQLERHNLAEEPLIVRVKASEKGTAALDTQVPTTFPEITAYSPTLGRNNLELLLAKFRPQATKTAEELEAELLVPGVQTTKPTAVISTPQTTLVPSAVHMTLLVGNGLRGALNALELAKSNPSSVIKTAVNLKSGTAVKEELEIQSQNYAYSPSQPHGLLDPNSSLPFFTVDSFAAIEGLDALRAGRAEVFSELWTEGNVKQIRDWLRANTEATDKIKPPVQHLIGSILSRAKEGLEQQERQQQLSQHNQANLVEIEATIRRLDQEIVSWAQSAHEELQSRLDSAFSNHLWRSLSWWKLFWRADDVTLNTSELVMSYFLPRAEQEVVYLAGKVAASFPTISPAISYPVDPEEKLVSTPGPTAVEMEHHGKWPVQITSTRQYLLETTVPALQALAQKLVVQSASLTGLNSVLAGLVYFSGFGAYECGAIAALGLVVALKRMQKRWDEARGYWEEEVREEGRKAVKRVEGQVARGVGDVLFRGVKTEGVGGGRGERVREVLEEADEVLRRL
ncbi:uncharacterized protein QC763_208750 [Podospora pseudopauciseta]|uniref:Mmc1 C-terminal domain-containing protein n=1 Tax=Podospora pseudopauciseta TaxID=2093780 RepID=A0ABR0HQJ1_9PEZI|nr:hypothetical protein QC763_208750 [Podospora pseudopauciseta]